MIIFIRRLAAGLAYLCFVAVVFFLFGIQIVGPFIPIDPNDSAALDGLAILGALIFLSTVLTTIPLGLALTLVSFLFGDRDWLLLISAGSALLLLMELMLELQIPFAWNLFYLFVFLLAFCIFVALGRRIIQIWNAIRRISELKPN